MPPADPDPKLRLRAADADDLLIVSAQLQDAIVPVTDISYLAAERTFVMVVNRFMWNAVPAAVGADASQAAGDGGPVFLRCHCGVRIGQVERAQTQALDLRDRSAMLDLLGLRHDAGTILLTFSGGPELRLRVSAIEVALEDFGEPWPTRRTPTHGLIDAEDLD
ncbi:MAG: DUF2948 family protein [Rhodospirillaceae bacterium]|nr:DUF2948 family protein [Rhodospirillaceae bacterium]